nr:Dot/Icm T4SS effector AnkG/AnkZ/LegA7 [Legionella shakespearei]
MCLSAAALITVLINTGLNALKRINKESLSHEAILNLLTQLGYSDDFEGVCYGFSLNWALAVAEGQEKEALFYQQVNLLRAHQSDLPSALARVEYKKQVQERLSPEEQIIETLPALCKKICTAQDPIMYKKTYGKLVWQPDITTILQTIDTDASSIRQIFYKTHTFSSRQEAVDYFELLKRIGIGSDVAVVISTATHAMGFKREGNSWLFLNINDLYQQQKDKPYFTFTSKQLVQELYRVSTAKPLSRRLTVNTDFIALKPNKQLSIALDNQFPVFPAGPRATYKEKVSFMALAAWQGDIATVKRCVSSGLSIFSRHQFSDDSPIFTAILQGRRDVVKAMMSPIQHHVNKHRKKDGTTLLHIACEHGGSGIVEDLLNVEGIEVNSRDKRGRTPLMYACRSDNVAMEERLFELLFEKGASLTMKDKDGLTALDHAHANKHRVAMRMINEKLHTVVPTPTPAPSAGYSPMSFFNRASSNTPLTRYNPSDTIPDLGSGRSTLQGTAPHSH